MLMAHQALFGDRTVTEGRFSVPPISENGYWFPSVEVDSPMTEDDHVVRIAIFSEENRCPMCFELGPRAGKARIDTRIRLGNTQKIRAVAEMNDSCWRDEYLQYCDLGGVCALMAMTRIAAPAQATAGEIIQLKVLIRHPMETGIGVIYMASDPRDILKRFECRYNGETVFAAELFPAVAADPF